MSRNVKKLKTKHLNAAYLLAAGERPVDIARCLRVRPETLSRWQRMPEFADAVKAATGQMRDHMREDVLTILQRSLTVLASELGGLSKNSPLRARTALGIFKIVAGDALKGQMKSLLLPPPAATALSAPEREACILGDAAHSEGEGAQRVGGV